MNEDKAFLWFVKGFYCSSEGYNAEYSGSHLRPKAIDDHRGLHTRGLNEGTIAELRGLFEDEWDDASYESLDGLLTYQEAYEEAKRRSKEVREESHE